MEFDEDFIQLGKAFTVPLPDCAAGAFERLVDGVDATAGRELTAREVREVRDDAEEAMAGLVASTQGRGPGTTPGLSPTRG